MLYCYEDTQERQAKVYVDQAPNVCPRCQKHIEPRFITAHIIDPDYECGDNGSAQLVFRCVAQSCQSLFVAQYTDPQGNPSDPFMLQGSHSESFTPKPYDEIIRAISPDFVSIAHQAQRAEFYGLADIAGVGFRKAIEFLIEDYAIRQRPNDRESIAIIPLGTVIENYVADTRIKACAKRAVWLGNDETHYRKKHVEHDFTDMKLLIELTVRWIESEELTLRYQQTLTKV